MKELGIIEQDVEGGRGTYRFVNSIYPVYIWIESQETERRGRNLKLIES
jgi:hypothetical protein